MNPLSRLTRWAGTKRWAAWLGRHIFTPLDMRFAGRRRSPTALATGLPTGYLTTTGRRSGKPRTVPLLFVNSSSGNPVVVGTNWGGTEHPLWVTNVEAEPTARWKAGDEVTVTAHRVEGTEFTELWQKFVEIWPAYDTYVTRSGRRPKMFELVGK